MMLPQHGPDLGTPLHMTRVIPQVLQIPSHLDWTFNSHGWNMFITRDADMFSSYHSYKRSLGKRAGGVSNAPVPAPSRVQYDLIHGLMVIHVKRSNLFPPWLGFVCVCLQNFWQGCQEPRFISLRSALLFIHQNNSHSAENKTNRRTFLRAEKCVWRWMKGYLKATGVCSGMRVLQEWQCVS